jgi:O-antigen ligase
LAHWVLIGVSVLWPVAALVGGLGFPPVITVAGLLCLALVAKDLRPRVYMVGILLFLLFVTASVKWSPREVEFFEADFARGDFAMRFEVLGLGLILIWSAILMSAAASLTPSKARSVVSVATWAILLQLIVLAALSIFEKQALDLFSFAMPEPGEGIQNISRNGIIMALAAPFLIVGFSRQLSFSRALLVEISVFVLVIAVLAIRGVNGPILSVVMALAAVAVVRIFPRTGFKILGIVIALAIIVGPFLLEFLVRNADATTAHGSIEQRLAIWKRVIEVIHQDPIFGQGLGVARTMAERIPTGIPGEFGGQLVVPNHPHNMILQVWLETGAIGAILLSGTVVLAAFRMPEPRYVSVAGFLGAALAGQFMALSLSFDFWNYWWWACAGILAALIVAMARAEAIENPGRMLAPPPAPR